MRTVRTLLLLTLTAAIAAPAPPRGRQIIRKVFSSITTAQTSAILPNFGQSMHLLYVTFPAEITKVTGLKVRIEAAYATSGPWIPISPDVTEALLLGSSVYAIVPAYGTFPYLRVRSFNATGSKAMTVYYTGSEVSIPTITQDSDRYTL